MRGIRDWGLGIRGRRKAEGGGRNTRRRPLIPNPQSLIPASRSGITLLEVLVSIFILAVGLLGVAALIPIGKLSLIKTNISDRTGACGRAAMRDVKVRRMLNPGSWAPLPGPGVFAIDPLGQNAGMLPTLAGVLPVNGGVPRITLLVAPGVFISPEIFRWSDDLIFTMPEDMSPPQQGDRPVPVMAGGDIQSEGNFSWFLTVCPSPGDIALQVPVGLRRNYTVSVVVCYKRDFTGGEYATTQPVIFLGGGYGGGTIQLDNADAAVLEHIKTNQWVMLASTDTRVAKWYRVVGVGDVDTPYLSLVGPDWDPLVAATMVVVEGVTGVYTTTVQLDADSIWTR